MAQGAGQASVSTCVVRLANVSGEGSLSLFYDIKPLQTIFSAFPFLLAYKITPLSLLWDYENPLCLIIS